MLSIVNLPPDVLYLIFEHIGDSWRDSRLPTVSHIGTLLPRNVYSALIALSMVNRRMRVLIRPLLFRIANLRPPRLPPPGPLPYIQYLHIYPPSSAPRWDKLESVLLRMPGLSNLYWNGRGTYMPEPLSNLRSLMTSPTLDTLAMSNVWLREDTTDFTPSSIFLRVLHIDFPQYLIEQPEIPPGIFHSHLACIGRILCVLGPQLECLTLSGPSTRLSSLASIKWPTLRNFSIIRGSAILDVPFDSLLQQMPKLCSLTIALDAGQTPVIVCPPGVPAAPVLSCLRHFTLSYPSPDDQVFRYLSSELRQLSLRDTPRYYNVRPGYFSDDLDYKEPILNCSDVLKVLSMMSLAQLEGFELVYLEDHNEFKMLRLLAQCCPNLHLLELHRYPKVPNAYAAWYRDMLSIPVESVASELAALRSLRTLKLNFYFVQKDESEGRTGLRPPLDYWDRLSVFLEAQAWTIAQRVPFVKTLALLSWTRLGMLWNTWSLYHGSVPGDAHAGGDVDLQLVREDIYDEAYPGGLEEF